VENADHRTYDLSVIDNCEYSLANPWNCDAGRMSEYTRKFLISKYSYRAIPFGQLVSSDLIGLKNHWGILSESTPFWHCSRRSLWRLRALSILSSRRHYEGSICCLLDWKRWENSYFHWLFDTLPRALAVLDYQSRTGLRVRLLVESDMQKWQIDSLNYLGLDSNSFIEVNRSENKTSISADILIAAPSARVQGLDNAPYDSMCPEIIRLLADRFIRRLSGFHAGLGVCSRIFISRSDAQSRRIINEDAVKEMLVKNGFSMVCLTDMPFIEQMRLFHSASHIIAVHGAGLSNLLFSKEANVLEIFSENHGIRPDYFQLASINSNAYYFYVCSSINRSNDIFLGIEVLEKFIALTC
jgi:hypothetical protein